MDNKFVIKGYWTEPNFEESEDFVDKLIKNLEDLAAFHGKNIIEWLTAELTSVQKIVAQIPYKKKLNPAALAESKIHHEVYW